MQMLKKIKTTSKVSGTKHEPQIEEQEISVNSTVVSFPSNVCTKLEYCDIEFNNENEKKLVEYINKIVDKINQC